MGRIRNATLASACPKPLIINEIAIIPNDVLRFAILQNKRHRTIQNKPLLLKYEAQTYKQDTITVRTNL